MKSVGGKGHEVLAQSRSGYQLWRRAEKSPVTSKDVKLVIPEVTERLDRNFFAVRFDRVSELERRFLLVMADVPGNEAKPLSTIAELEAKESAVVSRANGSRPS